MPVDSHRDYERIEYLRSRHAAQRTNPSLGTFNIRFRGVPTEFPKIRIDLDFPRYRLANGRTRRRQEQYLADHPGLPRDFFGDPASDAAQAAQGEILVEMGEDANLRQLLADEGQQDPLVLTYDGYVVNGNRRLAVLRDLGRETHAVAVVLPEDATDKDISSLEMRMQMSTDGRAEYDWLDSLLTVEANISELGFTEAEVARDMGRYVPTIQLMRHQLDLVNRYLRERGMAGQHYMVKDDKQAFETLAKAHRDATDPVTQANLRTLGFNIIAHPADGTSVHRQIEAMVRNVSRTVALIHAEQQDDPPEGQPPADDTLLAGLDGGSEPPAVLHLPITSGSAELVHEAVETARSLSNESERANAPAHDVTQAARILSTVEINKHTARLDVVRGQLEAIDAACGRIRGQIAAIAGEG